jgi:hypothetical protein
MISKLDVVVAKGAASQAKLRPAGLDRAPIFDFTSRFLTELEVSIQLHNLSYNGWPPSNFDAEQLFVGRRCRDWILVNCRAIGRNYKASSGLRRRPGMDFEA